MMLDLVKPRSFVPIHASTGAGGPRAHRRGCRRLALVVVEDGAIVELRPNEAAALSTDRAVNAASISIRGSAKAWAN